MLVLIVALAVVLTAVWLFGTREPVDATVTFDPASLGDDLDAYLARTEADIPNLRQNAAKEIVWAYPASKARTPLAIVYVHGFSGAKEELRPLPDDVARALGANLFFTRLTGHGRTGPAMTEASVNDWINDLAESLAIAHRLGERVVVIGMSTGAALATYAETLPEFQSGVAANVLISPNFGLRDRKAPLLTMPFAREAMRLFGQDTYSFQPLNESQAANWTASYPAAALLPMAALARAADRADLEVLKVPTLFIYSPADQVVDSAETEGAIRRWGGAHDTLLVHDAGDPTHHVLAGRILSPGTTDRLVTAIAAWIQKLPK